MPVCASGLSPFSLRSPLTKNGTPTEGRALPFNLLNLLNLLNQENPPQVNPEANLPGASRFFFFCQVDNLNHYTMETCKNLMIMMKREKGSHEK